VRRDITPRHFAGEGIFVHGDPIDDWGRGKPRPAQKGPRLSKPTYILSILTQALSGVAYGCLIQGAARMVMLGASEGAA
jgi:hypothetical protein